MNIQIAQLERTLPDGCVTTIHWAALEANLQGQIDAQKNPTTAAGVPWANTGE